MASQRRELTIFFSDIRGFTAWTERVEADEVTLVLNEYFSAMTAIVERHGGTLDKFMGDCVMVFFGAPIGMKDHAVQAVRMAWEMQREIERLNAKWTREGREAVRVGMGVHTDFVTVGNFGSERFKNYTVIGRGVNVTARIEAWTPPGTILLSAKTQALVRDAVRTRLFAELNLKGITEPVPVFEVLGIAPFDEATATAGAGAFWISENGRVAGPFPEEGIALMRQCGRIGAHTIVKQAGSPIATASSPPLGKT